MLILLTVLLESIDLLVSVMNSCKGILVLQMYTFDSVYISGNALVPVWS